MCVGIRNLQRIWLINTQQFGCTSRVNLALRSHEMCLNNSSIDPDMYLARYQIRINITTSCSAATGLSIGGLAYTMLPRSPGKQFFCREIVLQMSVKFGHI